MGYSLTNTTKKKSGGSSGSSSTKGSKGGMTVTVTKSDRESKSNGGSSSSSSSGSSGSGGIKYDPNKDYAAEIQKAVQSGASQDYINSLNAQRDAKIKGEKLSYSSLTDDDIANYRKGGSLGGRKTYDSAGVIGGMDNGTYNIANPYKKNYSNFNADVDFDGKIAAAKASGASQETINGLLQQKEYSEKVRNGEIVPMGYGEGMGHTNREHGFTFDLGNGKKQTVFSNATNYKDAAKLAGGLGGSGALVDDFTQLAAAESLGKAQRQHRQMLRRRQPQIGRHPERRQVGAHQRRNVNEVRQHRE